MEWVPGVVPLEVAVYGIVGLYAAVGGFAGLVHQMPPLRHEPFALGAVAGICTALVVVALEFAWVGQTGLALPLLVGPPLTGLWLICGWVGRAVGQTRGRPRDGLLLGLCLGPVGWLVVRLLPRGS